MSEEITDAQVMREALIQADQDQFQILVAEYLADMYEKINRIESNSNIMTGMLTAIADMVRTMKDQNRSGGFKFDLYREQWEEGVKKWDGPSRSKPFLVNTTT